METITSLCKRRGIIYPSSEIYGGMAGFYDYGPLGVELKNEVKRLWWNHFVRMRDDVVGLDSSIVHNPKTWESSGHVGGFSDPMVDCKETKKRYRADQLFAAPILLTESNEEVGWICVQEAADDDMQSKANKQAKRILKSQGRKGETFQRPFELKDLTILPPEIVETKVPNPDSNDGKATLTAPRDFELMFKTSVGAATDASSVAYLRPETAQGIFLNHRNVVDTCRTKIPFGIAQIGKAFRNEITPRNFIFRSREFEQMEVEYFIKPDKVTDDDGNDVGEGEDKRGWRVQHQEWLEESRKFLLSLGIREDLLGLDIHPDTDLAHYALACTDVTFEFPSFGVRELMGIAARGNHDLKSHQEGSGKSLEYYDDVTKEKYIPHCIEPSLGVDRLILALICSAYDEDIVAGGKKGAGEARSLLKFHPSVAPIKVAILPLLKNRDVLVDKAREIHDKLKRRWNVSWDASGAIGRRYRRADEVGTPFCITVDFETVEGDGTVTLRERDGTEQIRIAPDKVLAYLSEKIDGY